MNLYCTKNEIQTVSEVSRLLILLLKLNLNNFSFQPDCGKLLK